MLQHAVCVIGRLHIQHGHLDIYPFQSYADRYLQLCYSLRLAVTFKSIFDFKKFAAWTFCMKVAKTNYEQLKLIQRCNSLLRSRKMDELWHFKWSDPNNFVIIFWRAISPRCCPRIMRNGHPKSTNTYTMTIHKIENKSKILNQI